MDEDTALVLDATTKTIAVVGSGHVTIVDARRAQWQTSSAGTAVTGLLLSFLSPGDRFDLRDGSFIPASYFKPTVGNEYGDHRPLPGGGIAIAFSGTAEMLGTELLDNRDATQLERFGFVLEDPDQPSNSRRGAGVRFLFTQTPQSQGYWGHGPDGEPRYSIRDVSLDIAPVVLTIQTPAD